MKMLKALLAVRFAGFGASLFRFGKKKGGGRGALIGGAVLLIYLIGVFLFMFGVMFNTLAEPFHAAGIDWFYFALMATLAFALMFIFSIFLAQSVLFEAKDNEALLSLPVPPPMILLSRILTLVLLNLAYGAVVFAPALFIYIRHGFAFPAVSYVWAVVLLICVALFSTALSCLFGALLSALTSRVRNKSLFTVAISAVFLVAYFFFYSKVYTYLEMLAANGAEIAGAAKNAAVPLYWLGSAVASGSVSHFLLSALCLVIPFAAAYAILSACFARIISTHRGANKVKYVRRALSVSSGRTAMLKRELAHFFATPGYILNSGIGNLMLIVAVVFAVIKKDMLTSTLAMMPELSAITGVLAAAALCFIVSMNTITAPVVSLEGKSLWIVRTCPVSSVAVLQSKLLMQIVINTPLLVICAPVLAVLLRLGAAETAMTVLLPVMFNVFFALIGLTVNLFFPKLDWVNETMCVKSSASTMISMLLNMVSIIMPAIIYYAPGLYKIIAPVPFMLAVLVLYAAASAGLYIWLMRCGTKRFEGLAA